ncbi:hypothetical protein DFH06DRAFT_626309 [Mycena polygramma]|nr:hypothetical protein DFH06DRAFT_626309 [Mycena polygramma]
MSDPVAEKSGFLKTYMSSHPDTLVGFAKWYGKVGEPITSAEMSAIDSKGMTLTCTLKNGSKKEVVVAINPPLSGYEDAKPRLLEMKAISQEGLGMIKSPQITSFHLPPDGYYIALILFGLVPFTAFAPLTFNAPVQLLNIVQTTLKYLFAATCVVHTFESLYTLSLCWKHRAGFPATVAYVVCTFFIGLPTWKDILHRVKNARIESVMKVE